MAKDMKAFIVIVLLAIGIVFVANGCDTKYVTSYATKMDTLKVGTDTVFVVDTVGFVDTVMVRDTLAIDTVFVVDTVKSPHDYGHHFGFIKHR